MLMDGDRRNLGVLTTEMFLDRLGKGEIAFPTITEEEIEDRSKADGLAKGIAVLQTTWLDRKSTRLNSSHYSRSRMPSSA